MKRLTVFLLISLMLVGTALTGCRNNTTDVGATPSPNDATTTADSDETVDANATPTTPPEPEIEPVTITMTAIGDMLMHGGASLPAQQADGTYNYDYLFSNVLDEIQAADLAVVNQEVVFGGNHIGILGYPQFNIRTEQGDALVKAGFDIVLHATNHTMDQGVAGIDNTINFWKNYPDMTVLGIHESDEVYNNITIKEVNGIKLALLNYTYSLNGFSLPADQPYKVDLMNQWTKDKMIADLQAAKEMADFVIVFPHWGTEYVLNETAEEQEWAQFFSDNGADLIIATHPHVIQPVKWIEGVNGNKTLCYYSLGNFVSIQYYNFSMLGGMAQVSITKDETGTYISEYDMDFVVTHYTAGRTAVTTYMLDDYTNELAATHAILTEPGQKYMNVNVNYPFTVEGLKALAEQVCPDLADY